MFSQLCTRKSSQDKDDVSSAMRDRSVCWISLLGPQYASMLQPPRRASQQHSYDHILLPSRRTLSSPRQYHHAPLRSWIYPCRIIASTTCSLISFRSCVKCVYVDDVFHLHRQTNAPQQTDVHAWLDQQNTEMCSHRKTKREKVSDKRRLRRASGITDAVVATAAPNIQTSIHHLSFVYINLLT